MAVIQHENFKKRGYNFVAAFDSDPKIQGKTLANGLVIQPLTEIKRAALDLGIEIGVVTTQPSQAQQAADMFEEAGIRAVLNFAPYQVRQSDSCIVENADFTVNLDNLAYHLGKKDRYGKA
jgi:redox-sensing transcriptional repressor